MCILHFLLYWHRYGWTSRVYTPLTNETVPQKSSNAYEYQIEFLTQNTQYAYYVSAQVENKDAKGYRLNVTQGLSEIGYFTTTAEKPDTPVVNTVSKTHNSLTLKWYPRETHQRDLIRYYSVDIFMQPDNELVDERDYCQHPREDHHIDIGRHEPVQLPKCAIPEMLTDNDGGDVPLPQQNMSTAELAERRHKRKMECLLWRERHTFEYSIVRYLSGHENDPCDPDDERCEGEFDSHRFKRDLDNIMKRQAAAGQIESAGTNKIDTIYHIGTKTFASDERVGVIERLQPYTLYTMQFFSCNDECSPYYLHNERTGIDPAADNVSFDLERDQKLYHTVHLSFTNPKNPNGLTVAFVIEHHDMHTNNRTETCITIKEHMNHRYK